MTDEKDSQSVPEPSSTLSQTHSEHTLQLRNPSVDNGDDSSTENLDKDFEKGTETPRSNDEVTLNNDNNHRSQPPSGEPLHLNNTVSRTISRIPTATKPPSFPLWKEVGFVSIICMAQLLTQAALAQAVAPLHVIGDTFGTSNPGELSWLPAAYSLTVGTFILPAGRWGDLFGHRLVFLLGWVWFGIWTLVAGFAAYTDLIFFAFCRGMQGIGPALLIPNGLAILGRTYPPGRRKNMVFSLFGATAPGGFVLGATFSGIYAQEAWWPWTYWTAAMVIAACCVAVYIFVPKTPVSGPKVQLAELDLFGTILGVTGLILFNVAWNEGPTSGWQKVYNYVFLIIGSILLGIFIWWEMKMAEYPLLPKAAFNKSTTLVLTCIAAGWASFGIWVYYYWQFLELLRGNTILRATANTSPILMSGACAAIITGYVLGYLGPGIVMLISMFAFITGNILVATMPVHQSYWAQSFVTTIIMPFGMDMSFPAGSIIMSNHMPHELQGTAASILCVIQNYWISIGLGMAGTVETHVSGGDLLRGYRGAWYLAIGLDGLGIMAALALVWYWRQTTKAKEKAGEKVTLEE